MIAEAKQFIAKRWYYILAVIVILFALWRYSKRKKMQPIDYSKYKTITPEQREKLDTLHPDVKEDFYKFINDANKLPDVKIQITSAYRSYKTQHDLKQKVGRLAATPGRSPHQYGLAVDMVITYKGERLGLKGAKSKWIASGVPAIGKKLGMTWGGDFVSHPYDPVHFDVVRREGLDTGKLMEAGKKQFGSYQLTRGNELDLSKGKKGV
jgi:hypothetical protein